jgi:hypothetical protein
MKLVNVSQSPTWKGLVVPIAVTAPFLCPLTFAKGGLGFHRQRTGRAVGAAKIVARATPSPRQRICAKGIALLLSSKSIGCGENCKVGTTRFSSCQGTHKVSHLTPRKRNRQQCWRHELLSLLQRIPYMKIKPLTVGQMSYIPWEANLSVVAIPSVGKPLQFDSVAAAEEYLRRLRLVDAFAHSARIFCFNLESGSWSEVLKK